MIYAMVTHGSGWSSLILNPLASDLQQLIMSPEWTSLELT